MNDEITDLIFEIKEGMKIIKADLSTLKKDSKLIKKGLGDIKLKQNKQMEYFKSINLN